MRLTYKRNTIAEKVGGLQENTMLMVATILQAPILLIFGYY